MLGEAIRTHLQAVPFRPFVIQMTDGRRFEVPHPEFAAINRKGTEFVAFGERDTAITLSTLMVASLEPMRPAAQ